MRNEGAGLKDFLSRFLIVDYHTRKSGHWVLSASPTLTSKRESKDIGPATQINPHQGLIRGGPKEKEQGAKQRKSRK